MRRVRCAHVIAIEARVTWRRYARDLLFGASVLFVKTRHDLADEILETCGGDADERALDLVPSLQGSVLLVRADVRRSVRGEARGARSMPFLPSAAQSRGVDVGWQKYLQPRPSSD